MPDSIEKEKSLEKEAESLISKKAAVWLIILISLVWLITSIDWSSDRKVQGEVKTNQQIVSSQRYSTTLAYNDFKKYKLIDENLDLLIKLDKDEWSGSIIIALNYDYNVEPVDSSKFHLRFKNGDIYYITPTNSSNIRFGNRPSSAIFQMRGEGTGNTVSIKLTK